MHSLLRVLPHAIGLTRTTLGPGLLGPSVQDSLKGGHGCGGPLVDLVPATLGDELTVSGHAAASHPNDVYW